MGDSLFDEETDQMEDQVTVSKADIRNLASQNQQLQAELEQTRMALESASSQAANAAQTVQAASAPPRAPAPGEMTADEALKELANDPAGFASKVADGRIATAIADQFAPVLRPLLETTHANIINEHRAIFDSNIGVGKFDEIIMPQLQRDMDNLNRTNPAALGSKDTIRALVDRLQGQNREAINKAEGDVTDLRAKGDEDLVARVVQQLPPSMRPRQTGTQAKLDQDGELFFEEIAKATGEKPDEKTFLALHGAGSGLQDYIDAVESVESLAAKDSA